MIDVERALRTLELDWPETPALAARVPLPERRRRRPRRPLVLVLATLLVALAVALAVPPARSALLRVFGLDGATITRVDRRLVFDMTTTRPLGRGVTLDEAKRRAAFTLLVPRDDGWSVRFDGRFRGGAVTFARNDRRLLLTELYGEATPFVQKSAGSGTRISAVDVGGTLGYWLEGDRHLVVFRDANGRILQSRAAGNVLLWERGGVLLRLEGARTQEEAVALAGTLRPEPV